MSLLDRLLRRKHDVPLAALVDRDQKVLDKAEKELAIHERFMLVTSYREADQALATISKVRVK